MRTLEEIRKHAREHGHCGLTMEESTAYDGAFYPYESQGDAMTVVYSKTLTVGNKTVTKSASASASSMSTDMLNDMLATLKRQVAADDYDLL